MSFGIKIGEGRDKLPNARKIDSDEQTQRDNEEAAQEAIDTIFG
jgi:hypothetical protein